MPRKVFPNERWPKTVVSGILSHDPTQARTVSASPAAAGLPVTTAARAEHPHLRLHREEHETAIAKAIEGLDADLDRGARGEMHEYPDATGRGPTLFRYTGFDGVQSAFSVPQGRLTPHVRALMWELAESIEDAGRRTLSLALMLSAGLL